MSNKSERFMHTLMQQAQQQIKDVRLIEFGHIASYDPVTHAVKVLFPSLQDNDEKSILSGWMQLGTFWAGNKFGALYHPHGGATFENPEQGEQVVVVIVDRESGVSATAHLLFNDEMLSPGPDVPTEPGDFLLKHESGSLIHFKANGDIHVVTDHDLVADVGHDLTVNVVHDATIMVGNNATITVEGDANAHVIGDLTVQAATIVMTTP
jgi:hypothetical protein